MNELLELLLAHPEFLYRSRFTFVQRLRVLQAVSHDPRRQALTEAMECLNELRNSLAHQLEQPKTKEQAARFIELAFNAAAKMPYLAGSQAAKGAEEAASYSLVALKQAAAVVVGLLMNQKRNAQQRAAAP